MPPALSNSLPIPFPPGEDNYHTTTAAAVSFLPDENRQKRDLNHINAIQILQFVVSEVEVLLPSALRCLLVQVLHDRVRDLLHLFLLVLQVLELRVGGLVEPIQRLVDGRLELLVGERGR